MSTEHSGASSWWLVVIGIVSLLIAGAIILWTYINGFLLALGGTFPFLILAGFMAFALYRKRMGRRASTA